MINYRHLGTARVQPMAWIVADLPGPQQAGPRWAGDRIDDAAGKQPGIVRHPRQHPAGGCLTFAKLRTAHEDTWGKNRPDA